MTIQVGVFIPIGTNGWLVSTTSPQYQPSWELNRDATLTAERYGLDFALSMVKLRGFGGPSGFWDQNLESFTLMSALAAVTERIKLYASAAILTLHPALAARMAVTIDSVAPGRFGINIVTGWQEREFAQMGLWPGAEHYGRRYQYAAEYVQVLRDLWSDGVSSFDGDYFHLDDCRLLPKPKGHIGVVCAGQSDTGIEFCARHGDINFVVAQGVNDSLSFASTNARVHDAAQRTGRDVGTYVLMMIVTGETDDIAWGKWNRYREGIDTDALLWGSGQASLDTHSADAESSSHMMRNNVGAVNMGMGVLIGSYENVARMMDEAAAVPGTRGIMIAFDEPVQGIVDFGEHIQPLMTSRSDVLTTSNVNEGKSHASTV